MKKTLSLAVALASCSVAAAGVLSFPDYTKSTDGNETFASLFPGQTFSYDEGVVYFTVTMNFSNPTNPGVLDTSGSFGGWSHSAGDVFGQLWEQSNIGFNYYGNKDLGSPATAIPMDTDFTLVLEYDLGVSGSADPGTVKVWLDPALGTGSTPVADYDEPTNTWNAGVIDSNGFTFRRGNGSENVITFSNMALYDNGDSPFAVASVPEPSSSVLIGLSGLSLLSRRRRR
ncbi:PEP-CTERM sorting domain-containing protein [Rubritalea tangerina]|uniref:PEP-CTERM sorting domain-containing protein n=1 Tax=Rubritalea tangerina TaxID=430798 RepID=A0ABW4ZE59_9BACT